MTIYTSYYKGEIKGEAISISLYPPPGWTGKHLPLFAPTPELLQWWKSSAKDAIAQAEYKHRFRQILDSRQQLIQLWVGKQKDNPVDMTFCCFEPDGQFCHRHQVGEEVIQVYLPNLWGGEINNSQFPIRNSQLKPIAKSSELRKAANCHHPATFPPLVLSMLDKCHSSGYSVRCDRTPCGYYQVSLHDEDLGVWSELGLMGLLSQLRHDFYRARLVPSKEAGERGAGCRGEEDKEQGAGGRGKGSLPCPLPPAPPPLRSLAAIAQT